MNYDALLVVSFGGPEGMDDVIPFLENVLRGRNVPRERMLQVAHHYELFGGVSPINQQNRNLSAALEKELKRNGPRLRAGRPHTITANPLQPVASRGVTKAAFPRLIYRAIHTAPTTTRAEAQKGRSALCSRPRPSR